ncbi:MAG: 7TM diverse intracellular signaling domain-containing protein [Pseudomonadota bacterium]
MSASNTLNKTSFDNWRRLAVAAGFAFVTLLAIVLLAVTLAHHEQAGHQRVTFDGHKYFPERDNSIERFLDEKAAIETGEMVSEDPQSAMHGEYWLWFSPNNLNKELSILKVELAWLDHLSVFYLTKDGQYQSFEAGDDHRFTERVIAFRKPAFPLLRQVNDQEIDTVAIRVSAQGYLSLPLYALSENAFNAQVNLDYLFYGAWLAILVALGFYNATIFFSLRYNVHLYYIVYLSVFSMLLIIASGIGQQYIWPNRGNTTTLLANIALALTNFGTAYFVIHFIQLDKYSNTLTGFLRGFSFISLLCIPFVYFFKYDALPPILISSFAIMAIILPAAIHASLRGNQVAPFLFASLIVLIPCNTIGLIRFMGLFEHDHWTEHVAELGMVADALILSLALAYMVNLLRAEKDEVTSVRERERISFAKQLLRAKEEERKEIGKALHDDLGHKILSIKNAINLIPKKEGDLNQSNALAMADEAVKEVRDLSHLLYPSIIEHLGLEKAISNVVSTGLNGSDIKFNINISPLELSNELELLVYRAAQEFVNNLLKHSSHATQFDLSIASDNGGDSIVINATDDGDVPFSPEDFRFGLNMLKQQAALFDGDLQVQRSKAGLNSLVLTVFDKPPVPKP